MADPITAVSVSLEAGMVLLDAPHGLAVTLTPEAARIAGEQLIAASAQALDASGEGSAADRLR